MGTDAASMWVTEVKANLDRTRRQFLIEKEAELTRIRTILEDKVAIETSLSTVRDLRTKIKELL